MELSRRSLFRGLASVLAAPAVAKVASLVPAVEVARARAFNYLTLQQITRESVMLFANSNAFIQSLQTQWDDECGKGEKVGSQLRIRLPSRYDVH